MKIILLGIGFYYASHCIDSLLTNLAQHDDAWIPDAMMLLAIGIYIYCVFVGKARKRATSTSTNASIVTFCGIILYKKSKVVKMAYKSAVTEAEQPPTAAGQSQYLD